MRHCAAISLCLFIVLTGCSDDDSSGDNGLPPAEDTGSDVSNDVGIPDTSEPSDTSAMPDAVEADYPLAGFGDISGACDVLAADNIGSLEPSLLRSSIDFAMDPYDDADADALTEGGQTIVDVGNAGGNSLLSEVFAYEILYRCETATLLKTETEVVYNDPMGKITDLLVDVDGLKVGVSVTRAVGFPRDDPYTVEQATTLLEKKLQGVLDSTANVSSEDSWEKQVLFVVAYAPGHADAFTTAWEAASDELRSDTILWIAVSEGDDLFLYE